MLKYTLILLCLIATAAYPHAKKQQTIPAADTSVTTVDIIALEFDDPMLITVLTLNGPDGEVELTRETGMEAALTFEARPDVTLSTGAYTVDWRGLAADGHPMQGTFAFSVIAE